MDFIRKIKKSVLVELLEVKNSKFRKTEIAILKACMLEDIFYFNFG